MHLVLGGTGHIGSSVAKTLLARGELVTILTRDPAATRAHAPAGAHLAQVDVHDVAGLRRLLGPGDRLFLLNPPAAPSADTDTEERRSLQCILSALDGSALERVVALSAYGAQPGKHIGDLGVLYEMEQDLAAQPIPVTILRASYLYSNWAASLESARDQGRLPTFYPTDFALPMVAPEDVGRAAAELLAEARPRGGICFVEGPRRYTPADVAAAFAGALGRPVHPEPIPQEGWLAALAAMGFSEPAARSFANMTAATLERPFPPEDLPMRGETSLADYVEGLCRSTKGGSQTHR